MAVNAEPTIAERIQSKRNMRASEVVVMESFPQINLLEIIHETGSFDPVMVSEKEALPSIEAMHQLAEWLIIAEGYVAEMVDVIIVLDAIIPSLNHRLMHFLQRAEFMADSLAGVVSELEHIRVEEMRIAYKVFVMHLDF